MPRRTLTLPPTLALGAAMLLLASCAARRTETTDFARSRTATTPAFDARVAPASDATVRTFRIPITDDTVDIADGVKYAGWTFGGTVPGPVIRVRQGDSVRIELVNQASTAHSIDFHAARIPWSVAYQSINPGDSLSFAFVARDPGAFLVHCGTPPVLMHIMQGMYLPIIVDPKGGWPDHADDEFVLVQSEFYAGDPQDGVAPMDYAAALAENPTYVVFNGRADQYKEHPLQVHEGDRVRLFVVNAGPNRNSDFHVIGAILDKAYLDGNLDHPLEGVQTVMVPAGGGVVVETSFERGASGAGTYPFVTHSFSDATKGAVGMIQVLPPPVAGAAAP